MTLIVGLNLEQYVLVASDTRVSYFIGDRLIYRDDEEKIKPTKVGLITGAGLCDLLDPVKDRMREEEPSHTDAMRDLIRQECSRARARFGHHPDQRVRNSLNTSGWMLTYITNSTQYYAPGLRIAMMGSADADNKFALVLPGKVGFLAFSGIREEQHAELHRLAIDNFRLWKQDQERLLDNLGYNAGVLARVIQRASEMSEMVSPTFQIGVQTLTYDIGISNIFDPNQPDSFAFTFQQGCDGDPAKPE